MTDDRSIAVYGASGLTGGFVVAELRRRGWRPVLSGRDADKLRAVAEVNGGELELRPATIDDPAALDRARAGAAAEINCAGPFSWTAGPVIDAALRAGIPYLDVVAEIEAAADIFDRYDAPARDAGVVIVPAVAFYGGLGDLLATAVMRDWTGADEISIAYALDSWTPTPGTRAAGQVSRRRRDGRRVVYANGRLELRTDAAPVVDWDFPAPVGTQTVMAEFTMADSVTIPRHLATAEIRTYMTMAAVQDVGDPDAVLRSPADQDGRSAQAFLVEVVARSGPDARRATARGRDIYGTSAPLVVEATERVLSAQVARPGALTAGEAFDAGDFLRALPLDHLWFG